MRRRLLDILACPDCRSGVSPASPDEMPDELQNGTLTCDGCARTFRVTDGVPRMLPLALERETQASLGTRSASHFTEEFTALADGDRDMDSFELRRYYFHTRAGTDPAIFEKLPGDPCRTSLPDGDAYVPDDSYLRGKLVLDAGCGPGRFTEVVAHSASLVVGLDLGEHVARAARRCTDVPADFVQGSVLAPPFRDGAFDYVFSIGVLHHTPAPAAGCAAIARLVRLGGGLSVWVYGPEYWNGPIRGPIARALHRRLSKLSPERSLAFCDRWLYPLGRLQMLLARRAWTKLLFTPLFLVSVPRHPQREVMLATIHDYYCPPIITTHRYDDVRRWFLEAGVEPTRRVPVPTAWFGTVPEAEAAAGA